VLFSASGGSFGRKYEEFVVVPGFNEFVLELERLASLSVVLRDGTTVVPWGDELTPVLTLPGEENRGRSWSTGGALTLHMAAGGRYTLTIPPIPGYEPVPPTYVDLVQGETREPIVPSVVAISVPTGLGAPSSRPSTRSSSDASVLLAGTLVVPKEWSLPDFELRLRLLGSSSAVRIEERLSIGRDEMQPLGEDLFAWSAGGVQPGRYEACISALSFSVGLRVGPEGLSDALVVVPPPAEVRVRCVEASTGLPAVGSTVRWHCRPPGDARGWTSQPATEVRPGVASCRTPVGPVNFSTSGGGFGWRSVEFEVMPGSNELVIELDRVASLTVVLRDGAKVVPWGNWRMPQLALHGGEHHGRSFTRTSDGELTLHVFGSGRYTLTLPLIDGYEPVPPTEVVLAQDETREHVVELVRRP
jgi:hypothetical protein